MFNNFQQPYYPQQTYTPQSAFNPRLQQQPVQGLISVTGIDGAKQYELPPNSVIPLFDENNDLLYVKSTDGAGFPTIKTFAFAPVPEEKEPTGDYITRDEFNNKFEELKELIIDGKQPVQQSNATKSTKQSN